MFRVASIHALFDLANQLIEREDRLVCFLKSIFVFLEVLHNLIEYLESRYLVLEIGSIVLVRVG